jgi:hypothetical protein
MTGSTAVWPTRAESDGSSTVWTDKQMERTSAAFRASCRTGWQGMHGAVSDRMWLYPFVRAISGTPLRFAG